MDITIAVVTYNREHVIAECLNAILALENVTFDLVVVDNASTDSTRSIVREQFPQARLIEMPSNRGPNPARNAALQSGTNRYVLLVDDDVMLAPDSVALLIEAMQANPNAAITTGRTVYYDRPDIVQYSWMQPHFMGDAVFLNGERKLAECPDEVRFVAIAAGTFLLMDRDKITEVGNFDEHYFYHWDDADLFLRVNIAGYDIVEVPRSIARHKVKARGLSRAALKVRYRWYYIFKNFSSRTLLLIAPALLVDEVVRIGFMAAKGALKPWFQGTLAALRDIPHVMRSRRTVQQLRRRKDSELLVGGTTVIRADVLSNPKLLAFKRRYDLAMLQYWKAVQRFV